LGGIFDWFKHLWDDIKSGVAQVTQLIVSVADDIYVGIEYVVAGITHVVKDIIHGVEDVVRTIGSFFVKLGKLIKNVIEALSIVFHFDEILKTQQLLEGFVTQGIMALETDIATNVTPVMTNFFVRAEK